jgi:hypothetical protein
MFGLSLLSSVSKHNMWSYYDWVVVVVVRQLTQYVVVLWFNHNTTTYCVYWWTTRTTTQSWYDHILCLLTDDKNDNPIMIRPHSVFTDGRQERQPNHNTTTYCVHCCRCLPSVNTICGRIMIGLSFSSLSKHNMWSHYHLVLELTEDNKPNHNTTTYCAYWRMTTTTQS